MDCSATFYRNIFKKPFTRNLCTLYKGLVWSLKLCLVNCKILLLIDNCVAYLQLLKKKTFLHYFLIKIQLLLFSQLIRELFIAWNVNKKWNFCRIITSDLLANMEEYRRQFIIKDCLFLLADAWDSVCEDSLISAWHNLYPTSLFIGSNDVDFRCFSLDSAKQEICQIFVFCTLLPPPPKYIYIWG